MMTDFCRLRESIAPLARRRNKSPSVNPPTLNDSVRKIERRECDEAAVSGEAKGGALCGSGTGM